ncbi:hypothetical protein HDU79_000437 [Rhizoclosmatium sp. JEL0117]|nr:hypothetical protein HDU79_000437 [Rhizoclosmatium sp. JEL0117]
MARPVASLEFSQWVLRLQQFKYQSEDERRKRLEEIRRTRRRDIINRFAEMNPPISSDILINCEGFSKAWDFAVPLTNRIFSNIVRSLGPQIKERRIIQASRESYLRLFAAATEGISHHWTAYMTMDAFHARSGKINSDKEIAFMGKFLEHVTDQLATYEWSDVFPVIDFNPYLAEARRILREPYEKFVDRETDLLKRLPHLESTLSTLKESDEFLRSIQRIFRSRNYIDRDFENFIVSRVLTFRLSRIFERYKVNVESGLDVKISILGGTEWYDGHVDEFNPKLDAWNEETLKSSWTEWREVVFTRLTSLYRRLVEECNPQLLVNEPDKFRGRLNQKITALQQSPEWPLLSDLNPTAVCIVKHFLSGIESARRDNEDRYPDIYNLPAQLNTIKVQLTAPAPEFDENRVWDSCSRYFNRQLMNGYLSRNSFVHKFYDWKQMDFRTGFSLDNDEELKEWMNETEDRLREVVETFGETRRSLPYGLLSELKGEIDGPRLHGYGDVMILVDDILPSKNDFDVHNCVKKHSRYLEALADQVEREYAEGFDDESDGCVLM